MGEMKIGRNSDIPFIKRMNLTLPGWATYKNWSQARLESRHWEKMHQASSEVDGGVQPNESANLMKETMTAKSPDADAISMQMETMRMENSSHVEDAAPCL